MSKKVKALELDALRRTVAGVKDYVLVEPLKVDASTDYEFRKNLRAKKVRVHVVKNTFARKVLGEMGIELNGVLSGPTMLCWGGPNLKALATDVEDQVKAAKKDPKAPDKFKVKTAIADGQPVALEVAKTLPTKEEAIADLLAAIMGPGGGLAAALTGPGGELVSAFGGPATDIHGLLKAVEDRPPAGDAAPAAAG